MAGAGAHDGEGESVESSAFRRLKRFEARRVAIIGRHQIGGAGDFEFHAVLLARDERPVFVNDAHGDKCEIAAVGA